MYKAFIEFDQIQQAKTESERLVFSVLLFVILSTSTRTGQIIQNFLTLLSNF